MIFMTKKYSVSIFIYRVLRKLGLLKFLNLRFTIKFNNHKFYIPVIKGTGAGNLYGTEPWMIKLFEKITRADIKGAYYDVGVNVGQTLIKLKSVKPDIEYVGFEPNPVCVFYCRELISSNNFENTMLFPVGISDENTVFSLSHYSEDDTDSAASMVENFRPSQKVYKKEFIPCFRIDTILYKYPLSPVAILKIDVEGAEKEVLESFENLIERDRPLIQLEILPVYDVGNTARLSRQNAIEALVKRNNYTIFRIIKTKDDDLSHLVELETIGIHSDLNLCEYILVHGSKKQEFLMHFKYK